MPICLRIGPFTTIMFAAELVELPKEDAWETTARMVGKYSSFAPAMTAITAAFSTVSLTGAKFAHHLIRLVAGSFEHCRHSLLGRKYDRIKVGPLLIFEQALQVGLGIRLQQSRLRDRTRRDSAFLFVVGKRFCERINDRLHHRLAAQEIFPLDIALVNGFRLARDREGERDIPDGHAVGVLEIIILEFHDIDTGGAYSGYFGKFEISCKSAHGRYAAVSASNPDDYPGNLVVSYLLPESGIVAERTAGSSFVSPS